MNGARLTRLRWRLRGAWLWPTFTALIVLDALVGHLLPPDGDGQSLGSAFVVGMVAMLLGVILLTPVVARVIRRFGEGMPAVVARDYAGTVVVLAVSGILLAVGLVHHSAVDADRAAFGDAVTRAQTWIRDRGPTAYRHDLREELTYAIQPGSVYRTCVPNLRHDRTYCVVVDLRVPSPGGVTFSGYEPNWLLSTGTG